MPPGTEQPDVGAVAFPATRAPLVAVRPIAASAIATVEPTAASGTAEAVATENSPRRGRIRRKKPAASAAQAELAPLPYAGPTPANPFGGSALDIFDVLERVESLQTATVIGPASASVASARMVPQTPTLSDAPERLLENPTEAIAISEREPVIGASVQPVVIGDAAPAAERKRGWWRR